MRHISDIRNRKPLSKRVPEQCIIILSAGYSNRMRSKGAKCLLKITEKETILSRQINIFSLEYTLSEIIVVVGFEADRVYKYIPDYVKTVENERYAETNIVRSLSLALRATTSKKIIISYGDLVFNQAAITKLERFNSSCLVIDTTNQIKKDEVGVGLNNNDIVGLSYDLPDKWCQIAYITGKHLDEFRRFCYNKDNERKSGFQALDYIIDQCGPIRICRQKDIKIKEIDTNKDLLELRKSM